jgi:hypothetical protein
LKPAAKSNLQPNCRRVAETYLAGQDYQLETVPYGGAGKIDIAALADMLAGCDAPPAAVAVGNGGRGSLRPAARTQFPAPRSIPPLLNETTR